MLEQRGERGHRYLCGSVLVVWAKWSLVQGALRARDILDGGGGTMPRARQYSRTMNSTMDAMLRRSCSAAAMRAALTSGGTLTLTTSVFVMAKANSSLQNASVLHRVSARRARECARCGIDVSGRAGRQESLGDSTINPVHAMSM